MGLLLDFCRLTPELGRFAACLCVVYNETMSDLTHFANYTGGKGGASGPLNTARPIVFMIEAAR